MQWARRPLAIQPSSQDAHMHCSMLGRSRFALETHTHDASEPYPCRAHMAELGAACSAAPSHWHCRLSGSAPHPNGDHEARAGKIKLRAIMDEHGLVMLKERSRQQRSGPGLEGPIHYWFPVGQILGRALIGLHGITRKWIFDQLLISFRANFGSRSVTWFHQNGKLDRLFISCRATFGSRSGTGFQQFSAVFLTINKTYIHINK
jgi:hypothetical protein